MQLCGPKMRILIQFELIEIPKWHMPTCHKYKHICIMYVRMYMYLVSHRVIMTSTRLILLPSRSSMPTPNKVMCITQSVLPKWKQIPQFLTGELGGPSATARLAVSSPVTGTEDAATGGATVKVHYSIEALLRDLALKDLLLYCTLRMYAKIHISRL